MCNKDKKYFIGFKSETDEEKAKKSMLDYLEANPDLGVSLESLGLTEEDLYNTEYKYEINDEDRGDSEHFYKKTEESFRIQSLYKYVSDAYGPSELGPKSRPFCKMLVSRTKTSLMTKDNIQSLNSSNPGFGKGGSNTYDIFNWRGGSNCKHYWLKFFFDTKSLNLVQAPNDQQPIQRNKGDV